MFTQKNKKYCSKVYGSVDVVFACPVIMGRFEY